MRNVMKFSGLIGLLLLALVPRLAAQDESEVEALTVEVLSESPHDEAAYTQGLLFYEGFLYESTGRTGQSTVRKVDPQTGEVLEIARLNDAFFAEGLARVDDVLIQITWTHGYAIFYDLETFQQLGVFFYEGEGWGLCYDGEYLYMTDGSANLYKRDTRFFTLLETIPVTLDGEPIDQLNELECVGDSVYTNVWKSNNILRIDKATGVVTGVVDASSLLTDAERATLSEDPNQSAVLNGIAYNEEKDVFYVTGKLWPTLFEVRFVPVE